MQQKMNTLSDLNIYVAHVKKGYEDREKHVLDTMKKLVLKFRWILDGDIPDLNETEMLKYFSSDLLKINAGSSCTIKHLKMLEQMVNDNVPFALLLEDDFIPSPQFKKVLIEILNHVSELPPSFFISLENTGFKTLPEDSVQVGKYLFEANKTRCAAAYILDRKAAETILKFTYEKKCSEIIDWHYNTIAKNKLIKIFWCCPAIVEQGSHNGKFSSALSNRKSNVIRRVSFAIQKWIKK